MQSMFDDDEEEWMQASFIIISAAAVTLNTRSICIDRKRIDWNVHVDKLVKEGTFHRSYRMSHDSFNALVEMVRDDLTVDQDMSSLRTGTLPIIPEMVMHCLIRYMAGGTYLDVRLIVDISISAFYKCLHTAMASLINCKQLRIKFPKTMDEITEQSTQFQKLSSHGVIDSCVGCLDGVLIRIKTPSVEECGSVKSFYSGHYAAMGLNVQACCDHLCRFNFIGVAAPGGTHDLGAYSRVHLSKMVESLPTGFYVIGDNAYIATEHLITPFSGSQRDDPANGIYNYYCSQLRIRIEMAFGLLTTKWRVFRSPIQLSLEHASNVIIVGAILHNYVINCRKTSIDDDIDTIYRHDDSLLGYVPSSVDTVRNSSLSVVRERLVQKILNKNLTRPMHNTDRNENEVIE